MQLFSCHRVCDITSNHSEVEKICSLGKKYVSSFFKIGMLNYKVQLKVFDKYITMNLKTLSMRHAY